MDNNTEEIMQSLGELRRTVEGRLQDCLTREKAEKLVTDIVNRAHPAEAKAVLPGNAQPEESVRRAEGRKTGRRAAWDSEYGAKFGDMKTFLSMARKAYAGMAEGSGPDGGYLVPTEFSSEVLRLLNDTSVIFKLARVVPMSAFKRDVPVQATGVSVAWAEEAASRAAAKPTFGKVTQQAKVMAAIIKCTDELLRDSALDLQAFLSEMVAEAMALEIERVALAGKTASGDPFNGVLNASGVQSVSMASSSVAFDDVLELIFKLGDAYSRDAALVLNRTGLKKLMKLHDDRGNYLWQPPAGNLPATIWGVPYVLSSQLPSNLGTGTDETAALFGRFGQYLWISPREEMAVKVSQDAYDANDATNAFLQDQTWLRFTEAVSVDVMSGGAFAKLQFK